MNPGSTTVVPAGMPWPVTESPIFIPPFTLSIVISPPPPKAGSLVKHVPAELFIFSIGIVSTTLTAIASDSLYNISISDIFKALVKS